MNGFTGHSVQDDVWIDHQVDRFELAWKSSARPSIAAYIGEDRLELKTSLLIELIKVDVAYRQRLGEKPTIRSYLDQFPELEQNLNIDWMEVGHKFGGDESLSVPPDAASIRRHTFACEHGAETSDDPQLTDKIRRRFEINERLGEGGFGVVYRARDRELNRDVAIKMPRRGALSTESGKLRFLREAQTAAMLQHPGIVKIHDIFTDDDSPYIVSELIEGETLERVLARGPLPFRRSAELVSQVADALEYGHRLGVIHRDIKPRNIMINSEGQPVILDFGIAHRDREETLTGTGEVLGTPAYMPPECLLAETSVSHPTADVYSLAVVLYTLLTGEVPFRGSPARVIQQIIHTEPRPPSHYRDNIPNDLQTVCLKGMNKAPSRRYPSAGEFGADLRRYMQDIPVKARPVSSFEKGWRWCRRNPLLASLAAATAICLVALTVGAGITAWITSNLARSEQTYRNQAQRSLSRRLAESGTFKLCQGDLRGLVELVRSFEPARSDEKELLSRLMVADRWSRDYAGRLCQVIGATGRLRDARLSPTGKYIATLDAEYVLRVWDSSNGRTLAETRAEFLRAKQVPAIEFSLDEGWLIPFNPHGDAVGVWDWRTGNFFEQATQFDVLSMRHAFRLDGTTKKLQFFGKPSPDEPVALFQWNPFERQIECIATTTIVDSERLALDTNGRHFAIGTKRGSVAIGDVLSGAVWESPEAHSQSINSVVFSPDGQWLASSSEDDTVHIWSTTNPVMNSPPLEHDEDIKFMAFSRDSKTLATASYDGAVRLWRSADSTPAGRVIEHGSPVLCVAFSADGKLLATGGFESQVRVWTLPEGRPYDIPIPSMGTVRAVEFRGESHELFVLGSSNVVHLWRIGDERQASIIIPHNDRVWSVDFSADGKQLATACEDGRALIWSAESGAEAVTPMIHDPPREVLCAKLSPDQSCLLTTSIGHYYLWNLGELAPVTPLRSGQIAGYRDAQFSAEGAVAVLAGALDGVFVVEFSGPGFRTTQIKTTSGVERIAMDQVGRHFAAACDDGSVWIWSLPTHALVARIEAHSEMAEAIALRRDGSLLASASRDLSIRLWNPQDGSPYGQIMPQQAPVQCLAFSPDGSLLAAAGFDGNVQLWDVLSGLPCGRPFTHKLFASSVAFSPSGNRLATASFDRTARIWDLPPPIDLQQEEEITRRIWTDLGFKLDVSGAVAPISGEQWHEWRDNLQNTSAR